MLLWKTRQKCPIFTPSFVGNDFLSICITKRCQLRSNCVCVIRVLVIIGCGRRLTMRDPGPPNIRRYFISRWARSQMSLYILQHNGRRAAHFDAYRWPQTRSTSSLLLVLRSSLASKDKLHHKGPQKEVLCRGCVDVYHTCNAYRNG